MVFTKSNRISNPLNPTYNLGKTVEEKYDSPKFLRETMEVSDINDKKVKKEFKARENMKVDDINLKKGEKAPIN